MGKIDAACDNLTQLTRFPMTRIAMTFFTKDTPDALAVGTALSQRGRAGLEALGSIQKFSSGAYRDRARETLNAHPEGARLSEAHLAPTTRAEVQARVAAARDVAESDWAYRLERFCQRHVAESVFARGIAAIEERRGQFEASMALPEQGAGGVLELDETVVAPKYHGIDWHLQPEGWDGYDLYGPAFAYAIGPLVFRHGGYAAVPPGGDLNSHRVGMLRHLPKADYKRIYEPGCGGGTTINAIKATFPHAEVIGCDMSPLLLRMAHLVAERQGYKVQLKQRDLVDTKEPDDSIDAVVTYALHHELPPKVNRELFEEMYRILKPGGDIVLGDPPPFRAVDLFHAVILDWDTKNRGEPFFSASCLADWDEELREVGFEDVSSFGLGPDAFPWVIRARKPAETAGA